MRYTPSDDHEQCQSVLEALNRRQLERFNAATRFLGSLVASVAQRCV
jgi:hypothetical protein